MNQAQEYRLRNFVMYRDGNDTPTDIQVRVGMSDLLLMESNVKNCVYTPIALTEEWLLRFGFEKALIGYKLPCEGHPRSCRWITKKFFSEENEETPFVRFDSTHTDIYFAHTLQNYYFAITGEELKIK